MGDFFGIESKQKRFMRFKKGMMSPKDWDKINEERRVKRGRKDVCL